MAHLQFGRIFFNSAIFLLASSLVCQGKSFGLTEEDDGNDDEVSKGLEQLVSKSRDNSINDEDYMEARTNEIWNSVPLMPHYNFRDTSNFWPSSSQQLQLQSLSPNSINLPHPPQHKRLYAGDGQNSLNSHTPGQKQPMKQQQVLSNYLSSYGGPGRSTGLPGRMLHDLAGTGGTGTGLGSGFRYRPVSYNFRGSPNGRLSGYMAPISPRKRQILFRQCFFNPISCF